MSWQVEAAVLTLTRGLLRLAPSSSTDVAPQAIRQTLDLNLATTPREDTAKFMAAAYGGDQYYICAKSLIKDSDHVNPEDVVK